MLHELKPFPFIEPESEKKLPNWHFLAEKPFPPHISLFFRMAAQLTPAHTSAAFRKDQGTLHPNRHKILQVLHITVTFSMLESIGHGAAADWRLIIPWAFGALILLNYYPKFLSRKWHLLWEITRYRKKLNLQILASTQDFTKEVNAAGLIGQPFVFSAPFSSTVKIKKWPKISLVLNNHEKTQADLALFLKAFMSFWVGICFYASQFL